MKVFLNSGICEAFTKATGISTLPLKEYGRLDKPVSAHADMLINIIEEKIFCYADYYLENREIFDEAMAMGYEIVKCAPPVSSEYPDDIGLNALIIGKKVIGKLDSLAPELKITALEKGYEIINTKQGYTACATLMLDGENIITGDTSVKAAAEMAGIGVTLINEKSIALKGYNYGFIGGASFVCGKNIYVFGNAQTLSEYSKIKLAAERVGMAIVSISSGDVVDFGGGKLIL